MPKSWSLFHFISNSMSRYNDYRDKAGNSSMASDTFLSRVFGLHSIYNQLQDNYQFYDPDLELEPQESPESPLELPQDSPLLPPMESGSQENAKSVGSDKNLLDSESDLDLSSESETPPSPLLARAHEPLSWFARHTDDHVSWNNNASRYGKDNLPNMESMEDDEEDDVPSLSKLPKRALKFQIPRSKLFGRAARDDIEAGLPLFNPQASLFRKPEQPKESVHSEYQRRNMRKNRVVIPPKERALYLWANIVNMDEFLIDVYYYYRGKGFANIVMSRMVDVLILVFILAFTTFLKWGIDYDFFFNDWSSKSDVNLTLQDLIIPGYLVHRVPFSVKFLLFGFSCYVVLRLIQLYFDYQYKLSELQNFYRQLLGISNDLELMTISWTTIVERLMLLKDYNSLTSTTPNYPRHYVSDLNSKVRLNAHDIANRIMRKENYMIALVNKDVLDLSLPVPPLLGNIFSSKSVLTRTLEWNLKLCINNFVFNKNGQINENILKEASRNHLSQELSSRFKMAAIINLVLCPFIVIYFVLLYFFRYFNEYKSNPSSLLGLRQYTPWAEWKLREFNELPHFFIKRLHLSIGPANTYINQFPGGFLVINLMTVVNFVSGAIMAVLVIMGLFFEDEEHNFWSFELSENRSTLFYISVFGTLWAVTSNSLNTSTVTNSAENLNTQGVSFFYDPEASLRYVSQFTHYLPSSWNGKLHTVEVKSEFCELYSLKIIIIVNEILSLILTPFVLWFKISSNSSAIIDFFREYSIHVDGLGYVCYFAMFNFEEKDKNMMYDLNKKQKKKKKPTKQKDDVKDRVKQSDSDISDDDSDPDLNKYFQDDKMIKSYMYFLESYGAGNKAPQKPKAATSSFRPQTREGPSSSIMLLNRAAQNTPLDSIYDSGYTFDELNKSEEPAKGRKGVLGMINQFSKQENGRWAG